MNNDMDAFATDILSRFESLIDEEVETKSGATLLGVQYKKVTV